MPNILYGPTIIDFGFVFFPYYQGMKKLFRTGPLLEAAAKFLPWQEFVKLICSSSLRELATGVKLPWQ
jgi:hypothetical protein